MSSHLITEVKHQWALLVLEWVTVLVLAQVQDVYDSDFAFVTRLS